VLAAKPEKVALFCHPLQVPLGASLILYCVVQPLGAVVALTVILFEVELTRIRCAGGLVVSMLAAVLMLGLTVLSPEWACYFALTKLAVMYTMEIHRVRKGGNA